MSLQFVAPSLPDSGTVIVMCAGPDLSGPAAEMDGRLNGALSRAIKATGFEGEAGAALRLPAPVEGLDQVLLFGLGASPKQDEAALTVAGGQLAKVLMDAKAGEAVLVWDPALLGAEPEAAVAFATGVALRRYRFERYWNQERRDKAPAFAPLAIALDGAERASEAFAAALGVLQGVTLTRDLTSEPANVLTPAAFAERMEALRELGLEVEVLDDAELISRGFGAMMAVAQGSANPPRLVTLKWSGKSGGGKLVDPVAFVGKGVTFDTGGISLKPAEGMEAMKWDMGGAGIVAGTMAALAARKARVDAVGLLGLVENMPSGTAQRPGDVIKALSGHTIEVLNTDAEGRLVLADVLWHAQETYKPKAIVDLATLTGAMIVALGNEQAGYFTDNETLADALSAAGRATGDKVWRLPLGEAYDKLLESPIADMKNIGGRAAGSITAAQFLKRFIKDELPWAHIDVAGVVWADKPGATFDKGATGFGVRLLDRLVADRYE